MCQVCEICQIDSVDPITLVPLSSLVYIVKWLVEEADKIMSSNTYLAARMLTRAKDVASRISKMEVSCDQTLLIIQTWILELVLPDYPWQNVFLHLVLQVRLLRPSTVFSSFRETVLSPSSTRLYPHSVPPPWSICGRIIMLSPLPPPPPPKKKNK